MVGAFYLRYRADSNRCSSFCRAEPSLSATIPFGMANIHFIVSCQILNLDFGSAGKRKFLQ